MDQRDLCYSEIEKIYYIGRERQAYKTTKLSCTCGGEIEIDNNSAKRQHEKTGMHQKYLKVISDKDENYVYKPSYTRSWPYNR